MLYDHVEMVVNIKHNAVYNLVERKDVTYRNDRK